MEKITTYNDWLTDPRELPQLLADDYPEFLDWLMKFLPDWEHEYSGDIYGLFRAFEAGRLLHLPK